MQKKIEISNLGKTFDNAAILHDINFEVLEGESFVIMGSSGSGKSVLIKSILGLYTPDKGSKVIINDQDVTFTSIGKREKLTDQIGVLFQGGALFDSLKVWQNICFAQLQQGLIDNNEAQKIALTKLELVGLDEKVLQLYPSEISGGMARRVALARAIACNPKIIIFDEPTAGLDPINTVTISELIRACSKQLNATTITITHDMKCAEIIADKAALLYKGKFVWTGYGQDIKKSDNKYLHQFVSGSTSGPMN